MISEDKDVKGDVMLSLLCKSKGVFHNGESEKIEFILGRLSSTKMTDIKYCFHERE